MNSIPDEAKSGKTELSDEMPDAVTGGSLWDWIQKTAYDIAKSLKECGGMN